MIAELRRLDRRFTLLRGKRAGAFDRDQYYLEQAVRARLARKFRQYIREMRPVYLVAPRWSGALEFLDEIGVDVELGHPAVRCRLLSIQPLEGRPASQAWAWVCRALSDLAGLSPLTVTHEGQFRTSLEHLFGVLDQGPPRCLVMHEVDAMPADALQVLVTAYADHVEERTEPGRFNLVLSGPPGMPAYPEVDQDQPPFHTITLPDYDEREAMAMLAGFVGSDEPEVLQQLVAQVGGVHDFLLALTRVPPVQLASLASHRRALWNALGPLGGEVQRTVSILASDHVLAQRLEELAERGSCDFVVGRDAALVAAGLAEVRRRAPLRARATGVDEAPWTQEPRVSLRSPLFAEAIWNRQGS